MRRIRARLAWALLALFLPAAGPAQAQSTHDWNPPAPAALDTAAEPDQVTQPGTLWTRLATGGKTMIALLLLSVVGLAHALERLVHLRRHAIVPVGLTVDADTLWLAQRYDELLALPDKSDSTLARIIATLTKHRDRSYPVLSAMAGETASREMKRHLVRAYPITVVGTLAPLLGLLGTVLGMIESFEMIALAGSLGDARLLAGGISKALVTTGTGLVIAVPALGLYHFFRTRIDFLALELEEQINTLMRDWFLADESMDLG